MSKNIKIVLKKTMPKLGKEGSIMNVKSGYAFNYLIPNKIAELASKGVLKHSQMLVQIQNQKMEIIRIKAEQFKEKLKNVAKISIKKKTGDKYYIFGNINDKEITEKIFKYIRVQLDKKQIEISEIKTLGIYLIKVRILNDTTINLKLQILPINM